MIFCVILNNISMSTVYILKNDRNFRNSNFIKKNIITNEWADIQKEIDNIECIKNTFKILQTFSTIKKTFDSLKKKPCDSLKNKKKFENAIKKIHPDFTEKRINNIDRLLNKKNKQSTDIKKILNYIKKNPNITYGELKNVFLETSLTGMTRPTREQHPYYPELVCDCQLGPIFNSGKKTEQISPTWRIIVYYYF